MSAGSGPAGSGTGQWRLTGAVAAGGALGAAARYGLAQAWPAAPYGVPVSTLAINVGGCLAIGLLLGVPRRPLLQAFLGTGVLGGFTTFSTYAVESVDLWGTDPGWAVGYVAVTLGCALAAVRLGMLLVRWRR